MKNVRDVAIDEFPADASRAEQLRFLIRYAVLAPSGHNTQPWLFNVEYDSIELFADRRRALPVVDPFDRALVISCGAALFNLRAALRHFGYEDRIEPFPSPDDEDLLAKIHMGERISPTAEDDLLFGAISVRHTNRQPFEDRAIPASLIGELSAAAAADGAWLRIVGDPAERDGVADLIAEGDRTQAADKRFRRELAAWLHPNRTKSRDGIPGYAFGFTDTMSRAMPLIIRTFDWGKGQAAKDRQLAAGSPLLAVLGTAQDTPAAWLSAGQALERLLLRARAHSAWASFLNQPIEVAELRTRLQVLLGLNGFPQLLVRMGYGPEAHPTPRRPVAEVLID